MVDDADARRSLSETGRTYKVGSDTFELRLTMGALVNIEEKYGTCDALLQQMSTGKLVPLADVICWSATPAIDRDAFLAKYTPIEIVADADVVDHVIRLDLGFEVEEVPKIEEKEAPKGNVRAPKAKLAAAS